MRHLPSVKYCIKRRVIMSEYLNKEWQEKKAQERLAATRRQPDETRTLFDQVWSDKRDVWFFGEFVWVTTDSEQFDNYCFKWRYLRADQYHRLKERERWQEEFSQAIGSKMKIYSEESRDDL